MILKMINEELKRFDIFSICNSKHGIYIKTSRMLEKDEIEELTNIIISKGNKSVTIEDSRGVNITKKRY